KMRLLGSPNDRNVSTDVITLEQDSLCHYQNYLPYQVRYC
ncbi:MAG: hypothetical protein ACI88H_003914, partial [Cocleimonas sp.]